MSLYLVEYQMFHCMRESVFVLAKTKRDAMAHLNDPYTIVCAATKARLKNHV